MTIISYMCSHLNKKLILQYVYRNIFKPSSDDSIHYSDISPHKYRNMFLYCSTTYARCLKLKHLPNGEVYLTMGLA